MASWFRKNDITPYETAELVVSGIIPIGLIVIGTIGNLMSTFILLNRKNRQISTNVYLIFLCIMDTISLYQWNLNQAIYTFTDGTKQVWGKSVIICKLSQFFAFYTLHTSAMFLTFVELDRACLLHSRWYKTNVAQPHVALIICASILIILFGLNGFLFGLGFEYSIYNNSTGIEERGVACYYSMNQQLNDFFSFQYAWIHLVVMYILPFSVIIICTLFIVKKLTSRQIFSNQQLAISARRNRRISIMLLFMCLAYIICTLPNRLCFSIFADQIIGHDYTDTVFLATNTLMYTRNSLNTFFLYKSVHSFREDLRKLLLCLRHQSIQTDRNNTQTQNNMIIESIDKRITKTPVAIVSVKSH